jgi:anti-anti-sigma regulatory factor
VGLLTALLDSIQPLASFPGNPGKTWNAACLLDLPMAEEQEADVTLRITREKGSRARTTLKLEGRIVAEWAALLERECSDLLGAGGSVSLDLTAVRFVDRPGVKALKRLAHAGVEIRCGSGLVASVLEWEGIRVTEDGTASA